MKLRDYQIDISKKGIKILDQFKILYLAMEVRTGKTLTALNICKEKEYNNVLFITKKKAISSIFKNYIDWRFDQLFHLEIINFESLHKIDTSGHDCIIVDEAHSIGAFPKPSKRTKDIKKKFTLKTDLILLSGTPSPESYSQLFHQLYISPHSPFKDFVNFYKWAHQYVVIKKKRVAYGNMINDYSEAKKDIIFQKIQHLFIEFSQKQASFKSEIKETILKVKMKDNTYKACEKLIKHLVINNGQIVADTPIKLQSKLHQMYSGTIKLEDGSRKFFDTSKADFIKESFKNRKIAIFYKFIAELNMLKSVFGDNLTTDLDEFNSTGKNVAFQIVSGREGTNLSRAEALIFFNIDFSATSYWQARDRMTTKDREISNVFWIFSEGGIETKIYNMVSNKKTYTNYYFKKDYQL